MDEVEKARQEFQEAQKELEQALKDELAAKFIVQHARTVVRDARAALRRAERVQQRRLDDAEKSRQAELDAELADLKGCDLPTLKHLLESGTIRHEENRRWAKEQVHA